MESKSTYSDEEIKEMMSKTEPDQQAYEPMSGVNHLAITEFLAKNNRVNVKLINRANRALLIEGAEVNVVDGSFSLYTNNERMYVNSWDNLSTRIKNALMEVKQKRVFSKGNGFYFFLFEPPASFRVNVSGKMFRKYTFEVLNE